MLVTCPWLPHYSGELPLILTTDASSATPGSYYFPQNIAGRAPSYFCVKDLKRRRKKLFTNRKIGTVDHLWDTEAPPVSIRT